MWLKWGGLVWNAVADGPTVTVKLDVNTMTDISHPLTFPVIKNNNNVRGSRMFFFLVLSLSRENEIMPPPVAATGGFDRSPTLIFIPVTLGRACTLSKALLFIFFGGQLQRSSLRWLTQGLLTHGNRWVSASAAFCSAFSSQTEEAWLHLHPQFAAPRP